MYRLMCTCINTYDGIYYYIVIYCILYILLMSSYLCLLYMIGVWLKSSAHF